jgi:UDP-N-acetylmuramoyl-tripeptide--D-alanyl-D-alanine ligase
MNAMTMKKHPAIIDWPEDPSDTRGMALWTSDELAAATGGAVSAEFEVAGAEIDSREVMEGDLFFALKGEASDGHRFLDGAFARGAAAAVVDRAISQPHVLVNDTFAALEALARASRARVDDSAKIIGVTGSAGKTGVKEALFAALDRGSQGRAHRSLKSYNNHVGVPLSLVRMPPRTQFGVFEMGMNHPGELSQLTRLVRPHVAIVTTIAPAHIGFFKDEAAIADAKGEIFEGLAGLENLGGGVAIIPADSPHYARLRAKAEQHAARIVPFGLAAHAEARIIDAVGAPGGGTLVTAQLGDRRLCYTVSQPGEHWVVNSLAVMAAVMAVGGDLGAAGLALAEMEGLTGRGARHTVPAAGGDGSGTALVIDESYNANPASMRVTIAALGAARAHRRIAVLGAMKELGEQSDRYHAELAEPLLAAKVDRVILVGPEMAPLAAALTAVTSSRPGKSAATDLAAPIDVSHVEDARTAITRLGDEGIAAGDAILVKGSNSVGLGAVVRALTAREA